MGNLVDRIIEYEQGGMEDMDAVELFSELVKCGLAWTLQGHYGRSAQALIDSGVLDRDGTINHERVAELTNTA